MKQDRNSAVYFVPFTILSFLFISCSSEIRNKDPKLNDTIQGENSVSSGKKIPETTVRFPVMDSVFRKENFHNDAWRVVKIDGSCDSCREAGDTSVYGQLVHIKKNSLGYVRIRKDATCFNPECVVNLIGIIPDDITIYVQGPLKNADYSDGIAYALIVEDKKGKRCRGYLSFTVLEGYDF